MYAQAEPQSGEQKCLPLSYGKNLFFNEEIKHYCCFSVYTFNRVNVDVSCFDARMSETC